MRHPHRCQVMAQKVEPLAHADELAELWNNLLRYHRRALLVLAYADPDLDSRVWQDLPTDARVRLVRAMRSLTELAVDCAVVLERAAASLDRAAPPSFRESLVNDVAELVGLPAERLDHYRRMSKRRK